MSAGAFFRASERRARGLPPLWLGRPRAAPRHWPYTEHRTLAEVDAGEVPPVAGLDAAPCPASADKVPAKRRVTKSRAKVGGEARGGRTCEPRVEPVSRPGAGRTAPATSERMDVEPQAAAPAATAGETAPALPASGKVDSSRVVSAMDARALAAEAAREAAAVAALAQDGRTWCARCEARVPAWFGIDCIEAGCSLKGAAHG